MAALQDLPLGWVRAPGPAAPVDKLKLSVISVCFGGQNARTIPEKLFGVYL